MSTLRWVDQAAMRPYRCAAIPYVGNGSGQMFLDLGQDLDLEHVYLCQQACELIAGMVGFIPADVIAEKDAEIDRLKNELADAEARAMRGEEFMRSAWVMSKNRDEFKAELDRIGEEVAA